MTTSYSDSSKPLAVYLEWELKDNAGIPLDVAGRKAVRFSWVKRMMVKNLLMKEGDGEEAKEWVKNVITSNGLTSVHELAVAANIEVTPRSSWVTTWPGTGTDDPLRHKLRLRD